MAAEIILAPGKMRGPCKGWCRHPECKDMKARARSKCLYCSKPVGYEVKVYQHGDYTVHAACHEDAAERNATLF
jgi:hypothetical protein